MKNYRTVTQINILFFMLHNIKVPLLIPAYANVWASFMFKFVHKNDIAVFWKWY